MTAMALTALLVGLLYGPHVWSSPFVYEDARLVDGIQADSPVTLKRGRGLTHASWTMIRTPRASHALNVGLHLLVVGMAGALLWQLGQPRTVAVAIMAVLALHPLTVETVAYAAARAELIAAVGVLLTLLCATARQAWPWALLPVTLWLAYAGKETGLVAVPLIPLCLWLRGDTAWAARGVALLAGITWCVVVVAPHWLQAVANVASYADVRATALLWASTQAIAVYRLAMLSVTPFWLSVSPEIPVSPVLALGAIVLGLGVMEVAWRLRQTAPLAAFGIVGCAIVAAPRFLVRTPTSPFNEHQWYLAMPFVACVVVAALVALDQWWTETGRETWDGWRHGNGPSMASAWCCSSSGALG